MDLLAEVLNAKPSLDVAQINSSVATIETAAKNSKTTLLSYLEDCHVRFSERPKKNAALIQKTVNLQNNITSLQSSVHNLIDNEINLAENQLTEYLRELSETDGAIKVILKLTTIRKNLLDIEQYIHDNLYLKSMKLVKKTENLLANLSLSEKELITPMETKLQILKTTLLNKMHHIYSDNIVIENTADLCVVKVKKCDEIDHVLKTFYLNGAIPPFDRFIRCVWDHILVPAVNCTVQAEVENNNGFETLSLKVLDQSKKPSYADVFANICKVFEFLSSNINLKVSDDTTTMELIGRDIRDNLSELIIKNCLKDTIPSNAEQLKEYNVVIAETEALEKRLRALNVFAEDTTSILEYANNIDFLFINKKCKEYIEMADKLMKKDLHEIVEVGVEQIESFAGDANTHFSKSQVSKGLIQLLELMEKILEESKFSSEMCCGRLLVTIETICKKYPTVVADCHKKLLQTIPQQMAIYYNNCIYLAFNLRKWNEIYIKKLPFTLDINSNAFIIESNELTEKANERFNLFVQNQIKQIEETIKNAGLDQQTLDSVDGNTEKCLRQCLRQQELLKTVWQKVLSYEVYNRTIGLLLSALVNCLVHQIVRFEDISTDAAAQLIELLKMIQTRGPKLFTDSKEINLYVNTWYKLNELVFVLNASLLDINDRWADGKGPLAMQFTPLELKQLIRALFQNTDRRAAILARIC